MIYPLCEQLILHDKVLCFLYKLYKNEGFAWWFRLRLHIIAAIFCTLLVRLSCFQKKLYCTACCIIVVIVKSSHAIAIWQPPYLLM